MFSVHRPHVRVMHRTHPANVRQLLLEVVQVDVIRHRLKKQACRIAEVSDDVVEDEERDDDRARWIEEREGKKQ